MQKEVNNTTSFEFYALEDKKLNIEISLYYQLSLILPGFSAALFVSFASLILVLDNVLLLKLTHALDFIEVNHEAIIVTMVRLDALSAEDCQMV